MTRGRRNVKRLVHVALGLAGLAAVLAMLRHTDFRALRGFGGWALFAVLIEGLRVLAEALATRSLHGDAVRVPWWPLLRAHAAGYALAMTMPAGRSVAEAAKAVMLAPWAEGARSAGVGVTNQALVMASTGSVALVCAVAAWALHDPAFAGAVALQGVSLVVLGGGLLAMVQSTTLAAWVGRRLPKVASMVEGASAGARVPGVPSAYVCFVAHRFVQGIQVFVLLGTLGRWDPTLALALTGASIVGTSVGVAIPGQLGAIGAAMALAAPRVGVSAGQALAVALVIHTAQIAWAALGISLWTLTRVTAPREADARRS